MKIKLEQLYNGRWTAIDDDTYDGPESPMGHGATEVEALNDFMEKRFPKALDWILDPSVISEKTPACPKCFDTRITVNFFGRVAKCQNCESRWTLMGIRDFSKFFGKSLGPKCPKCMAIYCKPMPVRKVAGDIIKYCDDGWEEGVECIICNYRGSKSDFLLCPNADVHSVYDFLRVLYSTSIPHRDQSLSIPQICEELLKKANNVNSVESTAWAAWQVMGTFFGINGPVRILNWFYDVAQGKLRTAEELFPITPEEIKRFAIGRIITPEELSDAVISGLIQHGLVAAIDRASAQHLAEVEIRKEITNS